MARASSLFCIKYNHWNEECGAEKVIVSMKENPEFEVEFFEEKESDWLTGKKNSHFYYFSLIFFIK